MIDIQDKLHCLELVAKGKTSREIYNEYYIHLYPESKYESFRRALRKWKNKVYADPATLKSGTYPNFDAYGATVQVNRDGEVVQAWVRQHKTTYNMDELLDYIERYSHPVHVDRKKPTQSLSMLEIPLYDMHFPLSDYRDTLDKLLYIIEKDCYDEINLVIGQDLFHNDDFRSRTSSGRVIEKVDIVEAWRLAEEFWYEVIYHSLDHANTVNIIYSKGNHDESLAWAFVQRLEALFPDVNVDDSLKQRKCIYWNGCFIGLTHGYNKKSGNYDLRGQFTIEYPQEFASSKVREIHAGHLHHEKDSPDLYGVVVRRLASAVPTDEWSDDEGYVGAHKRFMIFEWEPNNLKSIHFI